MVLEPEGWALRIFSAGAIYFLFSRLVELILAFYGDVFSKDDDLYGIKRDELPILKVERAFLLLLAYAEVSCIYGLMYYAFAKLPNKCLLNNSEGLFDSWFFSATTITTTGSGEIAPIHFISKVLAVAEAVTALFIAMALSGYLQKDDTKALERRKTLKSCFQKPKASQPLVYNPDTGRLNV